MKGSHPFSISYGKLKYSLPPHYTTENVEYCYKKKKRAPRRNREYLIPILPMSVNIIFKIKWDHV